MGNQFISLPIIAKSEGQTTSSCILEYQICFASKSLLKATDAIARHDQMLTKSMYNNEMLLALLRNQEEVILSRMEGTASTMDDVLKYEADHDSESKNINIRSNVLETVLYQRILRTTQIAMM